MARIEGGFSFPRAYPEFNITSLGSGGPIRSTLYRLHDNREAPYTLASLAIHQNSLLGGEVPRDEVLDSFQDDWYRSGVFLPFQPVISFNPDGVQYVRPIPYTGVNLSVLQVHPRSHHARFVPVQEALTEIKAKSDQTFTVAEATNLMYLHDDSAAYTSWLRDQSMSEIIEDCARRFGLPASQIQRKIAAIRINEKDIQSKFGTGDFMLDTFYIPEKDKNKLGEPKLIQNFVQTYIRPVSISLPNEALHSYMPENAEAQSA